MAFPRLILIVGPTAAGKSALALALAEACRGEIVSVDSQQVYRGMDIGTSKPSAKERARVPHHLIDVLEPDQEMTAASYARLADAAIADAARRQAPVVLAGGTGLYERALLYGLFEGPPADPTLRASLEALGLPALRAELEQVDPAAAQKILPADLRRTVRALEVYRLTGTPMSVHTARHDHKKVAPRYPARVVGICPPRDQLYERINVRVDAMMAAGLLNEVKLLRERGYGAAVRSQSAIGYAELHEHLDAGLPLAEAVDRIKRNSRHYARRQLSWYRSDARVEWAENQNQVDLRSLERYLTEPPS